MVLRDTWSNRSNDRSDTFSGDHGEWEHDGNFCVDGLFYPDRAPSTGAEIIKFIYRPVRVCHIADDVFEVFNTTAFSEGSRYRLDFKWNDGRTITIQPDVQPLSKAMVKVAPGKPVDGVQMVTVVSTDTKTGRVVSEEQIVLARKVRGAPALQALPQGYTVGGGRLTYRRSGKTIVTGAEEGTVLYRAGTDNDADALFRRLMAPYQAQTEEVVSSEQIANGFRVVTRVSNRKNRFTVTDTYEGVDGGVLVTSVLHCVSGGMTRVTFQAVDSPFELSVKPYTDRALCSMRHREDEARTGTYVTIQAFQQGIGTGACGPGIMRPFQYSAKRDYTLKFLVRVEK